MGALVIYESMFGNTEEIARAVAAGLSAQVDVELVEVGDAATTIDPTVELLVVGGPTHAFGMSRPRTREAAAQQSDGPLVSSGIGLREWLAACAPAAVAAAAFDTRIRRPRVPGSAARAAQRRLRALGLRPIARPETFWVGGTTGPLLEGERDRARRWGEELGSVYVATPAARCEAVPS